MLAKKIKIKKSENFFWYAVANFNLSTSMCIFYTWIFSLGGKPHGGSCQLNLWSGFVNFWSIAAEKNFGFLLWNTLSLRKKNTLLWTASKSHFTMHCWYTQKADPRQHQQDHVKLSTWDYITVILYKDNLGFADMVKHLKLMIWVHYLK